MGNGGGLPEGVTSEQRLKEREENEPSGHLGGRAFWAEGTATAETLRQDCLSLSFGNSKVLRHNSASRRGSGGYKVIIMQDLGGPYGELPLLLSESGGS